MKKNLTETKVSLKKFAKSCRNNAGELATDSQPGKV
jgi:hypothetical protein